MLSATVVGIEAQPVWVEVDVGPGLPTFAIVGLPDAAVCEARERVRTALRRIGYAIPPRRIVVNLAPGDRRKEGPAFDLPIALGVLIATGYLAQGQADGHLAVGELGLDGGLRPVPGVLAVARAARRAGARALLVPVASAAEAAVAEEVQVYAAGDLSAAVAHLIGRAPLDPVQPSPHRAPATDPPPLDLADVRGQPAARRALEIAAAGGLNLLLYGPPGAGKTMLARRLPSILPPLGRDEAVEVTTIYSVAGRLPACRGLLWDRPFRAPHHTASAAAITGTATRPGEITLAHRGVLFLDELPEFRRDVLESLRQPLEDGAITVARAHGVVRYPACCALVAAMNPCPCGYRGDPERACTCTPAQVQRYLARLSGPLLDRIDLHVEVPRPPAGAIVAAERGESSHVVRARVAAARERAARRGLGADPRDTVDPRARLVLRAAAERLFLGGRAVERAVRVARVIADLEGDDRIGPSHVAEAVQYRAFDQRPGTCL